MKRDPLGFWGEAAAEIDWIEPAKTVFDPEAGIYGRWFPGAVCNTCFNALDRHVTTGRAAQRRHEQEQQAQPREYRVAVLFPLRNEGGNAGKLARRIIRDISCTAFGCGWGTTSLIPAPFGPSRWRGGRYA